MDGAVGKKKSRNRRRKRGKNSSAFPKKDFVVRQHSIRRKKTSAPSTSSTAPHDQCESEEAAQVAKSPEQQPQPQLGPQAQAETGESSQQSAPRSSEKSKRSPKKIKKKKTLPKKRVSDHFKSMLSRQEQLLFRMRRTAGLRGLEVTAAATINKQREQQLRTVSPHSFVRSKANNFIYPPWFSEKEFMAVYGWLYSNKNELMSKGVARVAAWNSRSKVPIGIDLTAHLCEAFLMELKYNAGNSYQALSFGYSVAITRYENINFSECIVRCDYDVFN